MFNALIVSWFLSFGYVSTMDIQVDVLNAGLYRGDSYATKSESLMPGRIATVAELGIRADFYRFSVFGSVENYQYYCDKIYFAPFRADYKFGAEFKVNNNIKLVFQHECDHPVQINIPKEYTNTYMSQETQLKIVFSGSNK